MLRAQYDDVIANQPVVIDNGSGVMKSGFAGDDLPKCLFPTFVGRPKHKRAMAGAVEGDIFVGSKVEELRSLLTLSYPVSHGVIEDWTDMEHVWTHVYSEMRINAEEHPVLLTESPLNTTRSREKTVEVFFETFGCPALFVSPQAILSLYASGRTTGLVLDVGDGVAHAVPVFEGFAISHGITGNAVAGRDVTEYLESQLVRAGHIFHTATEMEVVRTIKETACYVAFNPQKEEHQDEKASSSAGFPFSLPDGTQIYIGPERYRAPEVLFNPAIVGLEYPGIHDLLVAAITKADMDLRKTFYSQIVLSGGSTLFAGFGDRLLNEVRKHAPKDIKIRISAPPERKLSVWTGGSILASLATFKKMWVSKLEYEEGGCDVVHRKTF